MSRFAEKVAIVTGAGSGLGAEVARQLAGEGAKVVLAGRRREMVEAMAGKLGPSAIAVAADVTQEADVAALIGTALTRFGQVDVLVSNAAGVSGDAFVWEQTLEDWNASLAVNLTAHMLCSREVLRRSMLERKSGSIVTISSTASWNGMPGKGQYSAAKAGLRVLTKVLAKEAGAYGVRANCVVPGGISTDAYRGWVAGLADEEGITYDEKIAQFSAGAALKTISTPQDVARMIVFLASDDARTITGQSITVDAGAVMIG
jgi:3-oxoacyl-[acyl-carrier protein] reductase